MPVSMNCTVSPIPTVPLVGNIVGSTGSSFPKPLWRKPPSSSTRLLPISICKPYTTVLAGFDATLFNSASQQRYSDDISREDQNLFVRGLQHLSLQLDSVISDLMVEYDALLLRRIFEAIQTRLGIEWILSVRRNELRGKQEKNIAAMPNHLRNGINGLRFTNWNFMGFVASFFSQFKDTDHLAGGQRRHSAKDEQVALWRVPNFVEGLMTCSGNEHVCFSGNLKEKLGTFMLRPGQMNVRLRRSLTAASAFKESKGGLPKKQEQKWIHEGLVTESLPNGMFRVRLDNEDMILGYISGKMRKNFIRILPGDRVKIEVGRYDTSRGRIILRLRNKNLNE